MSRVEAEAQDILDALPVSFLREAESHRAAGERERWASGDQAVELIAELFPARSKAGIRLALARLYHCATGTIRDREYVCARIDSSMRARYPMITFHYWRACAQSRRPIEMADQIMAYAEAYGKLPSVDSVYGWVHDSGMVLPVWLMRVNALFDRITRIKNDPLLPSSVAAVLIDTEMRLESALVDLVSGVQDLGDSQHSLGSSTHVIGLQMLDQNLASQEHSA